MTPGTESYRIGQQVEAQKQQIMSALGITPDHIRAWQSEGHILDVKTTERGEGALYIFFKEQREEYKDLSFRRAVRLVPGGVGVEVAIHNESGIEWKPFEMQAKFRSVRENPAYFAQMARFTAEPLPYNILTREVTYKAPLI